MFLLFIELKRLLKYYPFSFCFNLNPQILANLFVVVSFIPILELVS